MKLEAINRSGLDWMPKEVWGPIKWRELHYRALTDISMDGERAWFDEFLKGVPCPQCREHFEEFLRGHPPDLRSRGAFFDWSVRAHNHVNRACGKKEYDVEEARVLHQTGAPGLPGAPS